MPPSGTFEYTAAKADLESSLACHSDDAKIFSCTHWLERNFRATRHYAWSAWARCAYLQERFPAQWHQWLTSFELRGEILEHFNNFEKSRDRVSAKKAKVEQAWPSFQWDFKYAPETWTVGLLEKLVLLSSRTVGQGPQMIDEMSKTVRERYKSSKSSVRYLRPRDLDSIIGRHQAPPPLPPPPPPPTLPASAKASSPFLDDAPSIEQGRTAPTPLPDESTIFEDGRRSVEPDLEKTFQLDNLLQDDGGEEDLAPCRKRRKVVVRMMDNETEIHNSQIKKMQEDRSAITKAPTYLARDPLLLQLQRNGRSNLMDGQMRGWAPELRLFSFEAACKAADVRRLEAERKETAAAILEAVEGIVSREQALSRPEEELAESRAYLELLRWRRPKHWQ
ncbi:hypothetical protein AC578_7810 [Pseudocercospora eumusae]|uniref:Uncharacterized protein n=1 Tax=Pseudocercospora eumusae TaxID=321146 RepID=A0A139GTS3_9PEZI|nr:hypothetical protein AC578_7810 [Pseudocercospora eumusae]